MIRRAFAAVALLAGFLPAAATAADDLVGRFAALESIAGIAVAPDGRHIALGCERDGRRAACVYELDAADKPPFVIRTRPEQRLIGLRWSSPEWLLLDTDVTENLTAVTNDTRLIRVSRLMSFNIRTREGATLLATGRTAYLTDLTHVLATPPATPDEILMLAGAWQAAPTRDSRIDSDEKGWRYGIYRVSLKNGQGRLVTGGGPTTESFVTDPEGRPIARYDTDPKAGRSTLHRMDARGDLSKLLDDESPATSHAPEGLLAGGEALAFSAFSDEGIFSPYLIDLATGAVRPAAATQANAVDFGGWIDDGSTAMIVGYGYTDDVPRQRFLEPRLERARVILEKALAGKSVDISSWSRDFSVVGLSAAAPGEPATYYVYDAGRKALSPVGAARPELAGLPVAPTTPLRYTARDGLQIDAYLTLPPGKTATDGPFPLLLFPHGGPYARSDAGFDWWSGYFAQRGYAVLQPNFRGSAGYGREFRERGYGEFGGAMIDDMIDGARHAVARGIADPARICTMGASYGGYAALMVPLRDASLAKCAIAVNALSEPSSFVGEVVKNYGKDSPALAFWEDYLGSRFRDAGAKAAVSPARNADALALPVLLLHGTLDTTVLVGHSRELKRRMTEAGRDVRLVELAGDDHYLATTSVRATLLTEIDSFLQTHIGR